MGVVGQFRHVLVHAFRSPPRTAPALRQLSFNENMHFRRNKIELRAQSVKTSEFSAEVLLFFL